MYEANYYSNVMISHYDFGLIIPVLITSRNIKYGQVNKGFICQQLPNLKKILSACQKSNEEPVTVKHGSTGSLGKISFLDRLKLGLVQ
ncbi:hypothetical protein XBP1_2170005 [Xenorhabdus bovienii str. puntauvense]|uniref:Uncharacterized protein n=1 Tax=Xenorhabdus bovienii str. puntauvense TaxID=1398201 RepID=A0A077NFC3_XENBV|nr:hypothetical protein XBP1_2170005 [Xenorhabdus bovienii str. puntauvense]